MPVRGLHIKAILIRQLKTAGVLLACSCVCPLIGTAQEGRPSESRLAVFEQRAMEDALYEQYMQWQTEEDELDYWTDQLNYERKLQKDYSHGYRVYISSKRDAYMKHQPECDAQCLHGDYYQLQAAFYSQFGSPVNSAELYIATSTSH
jgi:hypothetical protein